jgi:hypothetical protein
MRFLLPRSCGREPNARIFLPLLAGWNRALYNHHIGAALHSFSGRRIASKNILGLVRRLHRPIRDLPPAAH